MNTELENTEEIIQELSIGEQLAKARKAEGISLSKASNGTKLKVAYLEALEANNFDEMPAPIYAKNFIRIYGNYLGLDGNTLSQEFGKIAKNNLPLPEQPKTSFTYYISSFLNLISRNLFLASAITACIILIIIVFKSPKEPEKVVAQKDKPPRDFIVELENYTSVYDLDEPLPNLK